MNILDPQGHVDLPEEVYKKLDIVIASIHTCAYDSSHTIEENTKAYVEVMKNPYVNIIGHPDDGRFPMDYEVLVKTAKETGTLLELNNYSLLPMADRPDAKKNALELLRLCKKYQVPISTGTDAHFGTLVGDFTNTLKVLEEFEFPEELVVSTDLEKLKPYLNLSKK